MARPSTRSSREETTAAIPRSEEDLPLGSHVGRYRIEEPVGRGGMGTVYRTFDATTNRYVALKLLAPGIPESLRHRFLKECETEARIRHEHVMPVYDQGWFNEQRPYFTMELLYEPITLADVVGATRQKQLGKKWPRIRGWAHLADLVEDVLLPIADGVAVANLEHGILHRDLKPENVLVDVRTRRPYLIDFGICRELSQPNLEAGKVLGTPRFLSPEQARGTDDPRTDVFGLGVLLRYALTGEPPLLGSSAFSRREIELRVTALKEAESRARSRGQHAEAREFEGRRTQLEDPELRTTDDLFDDARRGQYIPLPADTRPAYAAIVHKAMAVEPADRYADAAALAADLRAWLEGRPVAALAEFGGRGVLRDRMERLARRHRLGLIVAGTAFVVGAIGAAAIAGRARPAADWRAVDAAADLAALDVPVATSDADGLLASFGHSRRIVLAERAGTRAAVPALEVTTLAAPGFRLREPELLGPVLPGERPRANSTNGDVLWSLSSGWWRVVGDTDQDLDASVFAAGTPLRLERPPGMPKGGDALFWAFGPHGTFLASRHHVTYGEYEVWLDAGLQAPARPARLPPVGFHADTGASGRYFADSGLRDVPIVGLRLADIEAYVAWRAQTEGLAFQVLSAEQWETLAGAHLVDLPEAERVVPTIGRLADGTRSAWDASLRLRGDTARSQPPGPYGHLGVYGPLGELVRSGDGTWGTKGVGGVLPDATALRRTTPLAQGERIAVPFRIAASAATR